jgi:DNA-binding transcriptional regulator LsrR (DeoR family)
MAERSEFLARIAYLYYKEDLTQQQIAQQTGLSRPKIARLLKEARRTGIVRIDITLATWQSGSAAACTRSLRRLWCLTPTTETPT